jgi:sugar lactone lactonase YvrE
MAELKTEVLAEDFIFLEGPRWHDGCLWTSDMWDYKVLKVKSDGSRETVVEVPNRPSGLGFLPDGTPLVVSMADRKLYRIERGTLVQHADLAAFVTGDINDLVMDDAGRAYVGNFGCDLMAGEEMKPADLVCVERDGRVRKVASNLVFPNGMVIMDGGRTLVAAETFGNRLAAFDRAADGSLSNHRVYAEMGPMTPDGICLDQGGGIWVSSFLTDEFVRVEAGGRITDRIAVKDRRAVACQLGGDDGRTLFCLTFEGHMEDIAGRKRAGRIETARVAVPAAGSP